MLSFADRRDRAQCAPCTTPRQRAAELQARGEIDAASRILGTLCGYGDEDYGDEDENGGAGEVRPNAAADFAQLLEICGRHERAVEILRSVSKQCDVSGEEAYLCKLLLLKLLFTRPRPLHRKDLPEMLALIASLTSKRTALGNAGKDTKHGVFKSHWSYFLMIKGLLSRERRLPSHLQLFYVGTENAEKEEDNVYCVGDSHVVSMGHRRIRRDGEWRRIIPWVVTGLKAWHVHLGSAYFTGENLRRALIAILKASEQESPESPAGSEPAAISSSRDPAANKRKTECLLSAGEIDVREGIGHAIECGKYQDLRTAVHHTVTSYVKAIAALIKDIDPARRLKVFFLPVLPHARRRGNAGRFKNRASRRTLQQMWNKKLAEVLVPGKVGQEEAGTRERDFSFPQLSFLNIAGDFEENAGPFLRPELSLDDGTHANAKAVQIIQRGIQALT